MPLIRIKDPVTRARFLYADVNGLSSFLADTTDVVPIGISDYWGEPITLYLGYAEYQSYSNAHVLQLELASNINVGQWMVDYGDGRGTAAIGMGYARATESGLAGDIISVQLIYNTSVPRSFSPSFSPSFS